MEILDHRRGNMRKTIVWAVCGLALTAGSLTAQPAAGLIDVFRVQVRPDKSMEYENLTKKLAEISRKKGDHWIAFSTEYGASNIIYFAARRSGYGDIEAGFGAMAAALTQALGAAGMAKMFADLNAMSVSGVGEIRRRRWDLSINVPPSDQELTNLVAHSRWFRTIRIDVKPGRMPEFVDAWKPWQAEVARSGPKMPVLVTVTATAQPPLIVTFYLKSLKEIDETAEATQRLL